MVRTPFIIQKRPISVTPHTKLLISAVELLVPKSGDRSQELQLQVQGFHSDFPDTEKDRSSSISPESDAVISARKSSEYSKKRLVDPGGAEFGKPSLHIDTQKGQTEPESSQDGTIST